MSSSSYDEPCPNCEEDMSCSSSNRPYNTESGQCIHCGFNYMTVSRYDDLAEMNDLRVMYNDDNPDEQLEILTELPEQDWDICNMRRENAQYIKDVPVVDPATGTDIKLSVFFDPGYKCYFAIDAMWLEEGFNEVTLPIDPMKIMYLKEPY